MPRVDDWLAPTGRNNGPRFKRILVFVSGDNPLYDIVGRKVEWAKFTPIGHFRHFRRFLKFLRLKRAASWYILDIRLCFLDISGGRFHADSMPNCLIML